MRTIEQGLLRSSASVFLLSPFSLKRPSINFELGAQWMKNVIHTNEGKKQIPIVPACHSGVKPSSLPAPLNSLNAIEVGERNGLLKLFSSLQGAVGAHGNFREDLDILAGRISEFERFYTLGSAFLRFWETLLTADRAAEALKQLDQMALVREKIEVNVTDVPQESFDAALAINSEKLNQFASIMATETTMGFGVAGMKNFATVKIDFSADSYRRLRASIR